MRRNWVEGEPQRVQVALGGTANSTASPTKARSPRRRPTVSKAVNEHDLAVTAVLSGKRNFEGRISPDVKTDARERDRLPLPLRELQAGRHGQPVVGFRRRGLLVERLVVVEQGHEVRFV